MRCCLKQLPKYLARHLPLTIPNSLTILNIGSPLRRFSSHLVNLPHIIFPRTIPLLPGEFDTEVLPHLAKVNITSPIIPVHAVRQWEHNINR